MLSKNILERSSPKSDIMEEVLKLKQQSLEFNLSTFQV